MELSTHKLTWRRRRAVRSAELLDDVVDAQAVLLPQLPEPLRRRSADHLAELVMLGQAYRHYAAGWITRAQLDRRGKEIRARLEEIRLPRSKQLTERE